MRKFSDKEREEIREQLIQTGHDLLMRYGASKTTVKDITEPVGIAKPTFYQFFDAKSDLYIEIFERELNNYVKNMQSELEGVEDPQEQLERYFQCYVEFGEGNEFIQQVFLRGDYRDIMGDLSSEQITALEQREMEALIPPFVEIQKQCEGPISKMEPLTVLGMMGSSLGFMVIHKNEIEEVSADLEEVDDGFYYHVRDVLISTLARGLVLKE